MKLRLVSGFALLALMASFAGPVSAKVTVSTFVSKIYAGDGGDALNAFLDNPGGFAADSSCTLTIADTMNNAIRQINGTTNIISTLAGTGQYGNSNGAAAKATFKGPQDVVLGTSGEVYVADTDNGSIRLINAGIVTTPAKNLKRPLGLAIDGTKLYISEYNGNRISVMTLPSGPTTKVATIATPGKLDLLSGYAYVVYNGGTRFGRVNLTTGTVTALKTGLTDAEGVTVFQGKVYFVSGTNGTMNQTWVYDPATGVSSLLNDEAETEWYNHVTDVQFCNGVMKLLFRNGSSVYNADLNADHEVRIAGMHRWNDRDGAKSQALLGRPTAMVMSKNGKNLYLIVNNQIKNFHLDTKILEFLAGYPNDNYRDGVGIISRISGATQMALSPDNSKLYIADRNNNRIRVLNLSTKTMTTLSGAGKINMFNGVNNAYAEGNACSDTMDVGVAGCAYFNRPSGIAVSKDGKTIYVADSFNNRIRTVNATTGKTTLLVGGTSGFHDASGRSAQFHRPVNLLLSQDGKTLYVVDLSNHAVRSVTIATKKVTTLVGAGRAGYRNGTLKQGILSFPDSIAQGAANSLYLTEVGSQLVRRIDLKAKTISTVAGSTVRGSLNGNASASQFNNPRGIAKIQTNLIVVADQMNDLLRTIKLK